MIYLILFAEFFKIGLFSVGGGLATIPFLQDLAQRYDWFDINILGNMIAIAESTPGPIGINMATYAGFHGGHQYGLWGGILGGFVATMGIIAPAILIITIISGVYRKFKENPLVENSFYGIRPVVTGMIASAALLLLQQGILSGDIPAYTSAGNWIRDFAGIIDIKGLIVFAAVFLCMRKIKLHPIIYIVLAGIAGAVFSM